MIVVPRIVPMIAHATGDDATRGLGSEAVYSYSTSSWSDWLASIPWTDRAGLVEHQRELLHEFNFPLGPIALFAIALWPRGAGRKLLWLGLASAIAAIVLADHISPLSDALLAALPPLRAFRVPSRAILPVAVVLPMLALAAWTAAVGPPDARVARATWLGVAAAATIALVGGAVPAWVREAIAWGGCIALVVLARRAPDLFARRTLAALLAPIAALGLLAFVERIPTGIPIDTIEHGPARVRDAVLAQLPAAAMPLVRVELPDAQPPFAVSTAWAAGLGSLDGLYYPPRRFLDLFAAVLGRPVSPMTCNFSMAHSPQFAVYQQLYDVVAIVDVRGDRGSLLALPAPGDRRGSPRSCARSTTAATWCQRSRPRTTSCTPRSRGPDGSRAPTTRRCTRRTRRAPVRACAA